MKVMFLDCDGVLNCTSTFRRRHALFQASGKTVKDEDVAWPLGHLDEQIVPLLNTIVERTDCKIVVSSSWRLHNRFPEFGQWLVQKGFKYPESIIDKTGCLPNTTHCRGEEILQWLKKHPEVVAYAVVDDDGEDIIPLHPKNYVWTNGNEGLTNEKVQDVITMLNT